MEELLTLLIEVFSKRQVTFASDDGRQARALAAQQVSLYQIIKEIFRSIPFGQQGSQGSVESERFFDGIFSAAVDYCRANGVSVNDIGSKITVVANIPLLDDDTVQSLRRFVQSPEPNERSASEASQFPLLAAAALATEADVGEIFNIIEGASGTYYRTKMYSAMALYVSAKRTALAATEINSQIGKDIASAMGLLDNYRAELDVSKQVVQEEIEALVKAASQIKLRQIELEGEVELRHQNSKAIILDNATGFTKAIDQAHEQLKNFEATAREEMKLEGVRLNWENRFIEARWSFRISCYLLVAYLFLTIGAAYCFGLPVIKALANIELTTTDVNQAIAGQTVYPPPTESVAVAIIHQFGRLIVFSVPVFVWLWAGRALMRYFMRSMLLMDDARQRQTMLDTYFLLSERGRADERDRPLILWALFRQTPGHGPDGIEPPDFTEVINAGLKRASNAGS